MYTPEFIEHIPSDGYDPNTAYRVYLVGEEYIYAPSGENVDGELVGGFYALPEIDDVDCGDIVPSKFDWKPGAIFHMTAWDDKHRPECNPDGMYFVDSDEPFWIDIKLSSGSYQECVERLENHGKESITEEQWFEQIDPRHTEDVMQAYNDNFGERFGDCDYCSYYQNGICTHYPKGKWANCKYWRRKAT